MSASNYQKITETIIEALNRGEVAWQKPWQNQKPANAVNKKAYRGINAILLGIAGMKYTDHRWVTFKQAQELGGTVRKGEKSTWIVFYAPVQKKGDDDKVSTYWVMRSYFVFNVEQCDGLTKLAPLEIVNREVEPEIMAEEIWARYSDKPAVNWGSKACYIPSKDEIIMPRRETFISNAHFYSTLFHEGAHSTGHGTRMNRKGVVESDGFGGYEYSFEELVAEFTSAFLSAEAGLDVPTQENSVAYLQNWISALQNDNTLLVKAAGMAQKVADYMMGVKFENDAEAVNEDKVLVTA